MQESTHTGGSHGAMPVTTQNRDWTQGSIIKNLVSLSWPMIVSNSLNVLGPTVDMIWVGKLGSEAIAAVGVAGTVVMLVSALMIGLFTGLRSMVARYIGEKDNGKAVHIIRQAMVTSIAYAVILAVIGLFLSRPLLGLLGMNPEVISLGEDYLRIMFVGMIAVTFRMLTDGAMQAAGDTQIPMRLAVVFRTLHVILCPFLVFGWWIFPQLGINGAAITNVVAQSLGTALGMWILLSGKSRIRLTLSGFRIDFGVIWRLLKIGIPASVMSLQMQMGQMFLMWIVVPFGTLAVAAHSLCLRIDMIIIMPLLGLGISAGVLVGQNLGARQPQRAEKNGWVALALAQGLMLVVSLALLIWAEGIVGIFNAEPELVRIASAFLRISVAAYLVLAFTTILQQCISGAGDTLPPMVISLASIWLIQVPLAVFLPRVGGLDVYGVRWAMVASAILGMVAYTIYFRAGRWKRKKV